MRAWVLLLLAFGCLAACDAGGPVDLPYWRGINAMDDGRPDLARASFEAYLEQEDAARAREATRALARSWGMGAFQSPGRAAPIWRSLLEEDPDDNEARLALARCLLQIGRASEARELLDHQSPSELSDVGKQLLGAALLELEPRRALELATGPMASMPEAPLLAAKASEILGDDTATLAHARRAVSAQPLNPAAYYLLSRSLRRLGDREGAREAAERHRDAQSLETRGSGVRKSALERLRALDRLTQDFEDMPAAARALRVELLIEGGLKEQGRQLLAEALVDPARFEATPSLLAAWAERLGDLRRSAELLESELATERDPETRRHYQHRLGRLYRALGNSRARAFLEAALEEQPHVGRLHCALGALAVEDGRVDEAIRSYESALRLAPWRAGCRVELARLLHVERDEASVRSLLARAPEPAPELIRFGEDFGYVVP